MMDDPALWHRLQFAFTITYHYLFPQLTMGLAWFLVYWKWRALRTGDERYAAAARFWAKIFGLNFAVGVVTGIPMEFQFGTNWANFSKYAGGVIGQTLAMEGMFAFLLESAFVGALVWGEKRLGPRQALPRRGGGGGRQLALGLLHPRDQRLHAAPRRLRGRRRRHARHRRSRRLSAQPLGAGAVRAQPGGRARHRHLRRHGGRRVLRAARGCIAIRRGCT